MNRLPSDESTRRSRVVPEPRIGCRALRRNDVPRTRAASSVAGWHGIATGTWCDPAFGAENLTGVVASALGILGDAVRLDNPHTGAAPAWFLRVAASPAVLEVPRIVLGQDVAIEASRLLVHRPDIAGRVPVHQDGHDADLLLDPERMLSALFLLTHEPASDGDSFVRVCPWSRHFGYLPHEAVDCGAFGLLPSIIDASRRGTPSDYQVAPGDVLFTDGRCIRTYGSEQPWLALTVRYVTPTSVVRRPDEAPSLLRVSGTYTHWNSPKRRAAVH